MSQLLNEFKENYKSMMDRFNKFEQNHSFWSAGFDYGSGGAMMLSAATLGTIMGVPALTTTVVPIIAILTLFTGGILPGAISKRAISASSASGKIIKDRLKPTQKPQF